MSTIITFFLSLTGFAALFVAIWLMHRPLQVHSCPQRGVRIAHRLLEWTLYAWLVVLACQLCGLLTTARRPPEPKTYAEPQELDATARNREAMRKFETCINTNDLALGKELIAADAAFATPVSPTPLYGAKGYLSVVELMRQSFPDVQWKLEAMVADEHLVAVQWRCSGTFNGTAPFAGLAPNGRTFSTTVMNFYSFDHDGKIVGDVTATGIAGILQGIGAVPEN